MEVGLAATNPRAGMDTAILNREIFIFVFWCEVEIKWEIEGDGEKI